MGKRTVNKVKQPLVFGHRPIGPVELAKLNTTISSIDWRDILTDGQVSDCYDIFITHFKREMICNDGVLGRCCVHCLG